MAWVLPVLLEENLDHIAAHKYSPGHYTALDYVLSHLWQGIAEALPKWLAPNAITFIGFAPLVLVYILSWFICPFCDEAPPRWLALSYVGALYFYQTMDAVDGKQARRTGSSTPLGHLVDHGCDCLTGMSQHAALVMILMPADMHWVFQCMRSIQTPIFLAAWHDRSRHGPPCGLLSDQSGSYWRHGAAVHADVTDSSDGRRRPRGVAEMDDSDGGAALGIGECSDSDREGLVAPISCDGLVLHCQSHGHCVCQQGICRRFRTEGPPSSPTVECAARALASWFGRSRRANDQPLHGPVNLLDERADDCLHHGRDLPTARLGPSHALLIDHIQYKTPALSFCRAVLISRTEFPWLQWSLLLYASAVIASWALPLEFSRPVLCCFTAAFGLWLLWWLLSVVEQIKAKLGIYAFCITEKYHARNGTKKHS
eukprot:s4430_g5.t2